MTKLYPIALGGLYLLCQAPCHRRSPWRRFGGCLGHSSPAGWRLARGGPRSRSSVDTQQRRGALRACVCPCNCWGSRATCSQHPRASHSSHLSLPHSVILWSPRVDFCPERHDRVHQKCDPSALNKEPMTVQLVFAAFESGWTGIPNRS